jgi:DNA-binding PucR family transcriptional regulator
LLLKGADTSDRAYVAISLAGRRRGSNAALRDALARAVTEDARVVRTAAGASVVREHDAQADPRAQAEELRQLIGTAVGDDEISAGVAGPKPGASGAHFALLQAEHAVTLGRRLHGHGRTVHFDELGAFRFVLNQSASDVREFAEQALGPLLDETHADLLDTLESYLRNNGSANAVARQMFLHRNSVRHRLRRIAKLTGAALEDPDTRLALQLAILGRRALMKIAS